MKLLLVNSNPVVSRLTALSARKESVELDEIRDISELKKSDYSIVFVDSESYTEELATVLKNSGINRRVLFYTQDEEDRPEIFNFSILKPFLPSEVSAILREAKREQDNKRDSSQVQHLNLDELISDKKDDLEPLGLMDSELKEEKIEEVKETPKKEKLKEEEPKEEKPKEIVEEAKEEIVEFELNELPPLEEDKKEEKISLDTPKKEEVKQEKKQDKKSDEKIELLDSELFELDNSKSESSDDELFLLDTTSSKDDIDGVLDLDTQNSDELDLDNIEKEIQKKEEKKSIEKELKPKDDESPKVLDKNEISNIKSLLEDNPKIDENLSLDDFMTTTTPSANSEKSIQRPKKRKKKKSKKAGSKVIIDSLGSLPVDDLRRLLLGAKVKISIKFPKE